jgi:hypothetical protein
MIEFRSKKIIGFSVIIFTIANIYSLETKQDGTIHETTMKFQIRDYTNRFHTDSLSEKSKYLRIKTDHYI